MTTYSAFLTVHSVLRWAVIVAGLVAAIRAWQSAAAHGRPPAPRAGLVFAVLFDVQLLLGLALYLFLSPTTTVAVHHLAAVMPNDVLRFWTIEHPFGMVVALVLAHLGRAKSRSASAPARRAPAVYFTLSLVIVLVTTPWPFMAYGRPLV